MGRIKEEIIAYLVFDSGSKIKISYRHDDGWGQHIDREDVGEYFIRIMADALRDKNEMFELRPSYYAEIQGFPVSVINLSGLRGIHLENIFA